MRDADVRRILKQSLGLRYGAEPNTVVVEELGLCRGAVRADLAVVNGLLRGYEIKSDRDTLGRLSQQAQIYSRVFDMVTIVVAERHVDDAVTIIPNWWGVEVVTAEKERCQLVCFRDGAPNPSVDAMSVAQLLWRDEVIALLTKLGMPDATRQPRRVLWAALANSMSLDSLRGQVRGVLKTRNDWRFHSRRMLNGETSRPSATSSGCLFQHVLPRSRRYSYRPN